MMTSTIQLDNLNLSTVFIPCKKDAERPAEVGIPPYPKAANRDLSPLGAELRLKAYKIAWDKCFGRIQEIIRALHEPVIKEVVECVRTAYADVVPGLPYTEVPVITISCPPNSHSLFQDIRSSLAVDLNTDPNLPGSVPGMTTRGPGRKVKATNGLSGPGTAPKETYIVTSLHPHMCGNIMNTMKALIGGFIAKSPVGVIDTKRKATSSLASYDVGLLEAWYKAIPPTSAPKLVVFMQEFEQFDPTVIQALFHICSAMVPRLPFIFVVSISLPLTLLYLEAAYPRSTLAQLRVIPFAAKYGARVVEEIILSTFFDVNTLKGSDTGFRPLVMIGPTVLDAIHDVFLRYNMSLENIINILQLVHMKHFSEPFTLFTAVEPDDIQELKVKLQTHREARFKFANLGRGLLAEAKPGIVVDDDDEALDYLFGLVEKTRLAVEARMQQWRAGFHQYGRLREFMEANGHAVKSTKRDGLLGLMAAFLRGSKAELDLSNLTVMVEKASGVEQRGLAKLGFGTPLKLDVLQADFPWPGQRSLTPDFFPDVWYMGESLVPLGVLRPNVHASVIAALTHPHDYLDCECCRPVDDFDSDKDDNDLGGGVWTMPDSSILFHRYLESPRMINVYDWYQSFAQALDPEFERRNKDGRSASGSPSKRKRKTLEAAEERAAWDREVHARFLHALHELDFMGFVNHTKRRTDHVQRTVFDIPDSS